MGKDLYEQFSVAREVFEEASDAIRLDLKKLCFSGSESDLTLTENTQPCLLTTSVAAFRVAEKEFNWTPGAVAGHSLGEYSALVAIGSLSLSRAVQWVKERGAAMQRAVPAGEGSMAAIMGLEDALVEKLCQKASEIAFDQRNKGSSNHLSVDAIVEPANFNAPGQVVIAGSADAVQEAITLIKAGGDFAGGKAIPLQVSAPFHCKLMKPARDRMAELFSLATKADQPKAPICPYVPNRTARISHESGLIFELLVDQVDHPVLWKQSVQSLLNSQFSTAVEFGPGKVLSGLIKRISSQAGKTCAQVAVGDAASVKNLETVLKTVRPS
jgi:[acyl-carrier-protein] S-malonyltransferase